MWGTGSRSAANGHSQRGFTLIEMLVVLAITGLISGIGFPRVEAMIAEMENRAAASSVEFSLRQTRAFAISRDVASTFAVAADGHAFSGSDKVDRPLADSVLIRAPQGNIIFFGDGTSGGGVVDIVSRLSVRRVVIDADTGAIGPAQ